MFKFSAVISTIAAVTVCAGVLALSGCGSEASADRAARDAMAQADQARAQDSGLENLNKVQKTLDDLAGNPNLSDVMEVLVRSRQAQVRLERIMLMIADLRSQELAITRSINDIENLGMQVASAQASAQALTAYEPTGQIDKLKAQEAQITGSATQLTWQMPSPTASDPNATTALPTLWAVKHQIDTLTSQIQDNQSQTDAAHKLSAAKGDEAEQYLRRAEGELGDQQVNDTVHAATDRRDAALADSRATALANQLSRLQASLDQTKVQESALESAVASLDAQIQAQQDRWTNISQQIQGEQKVEADLVSGSSGDGGVTMDLLATNLASALQTAAKTREDVNDELNALIPQLQTVVTRCNQLRNTWKQDENTQQDSPDIVVWRQAEETLHPMYFNLQMASALEARASVAAAKARIDLMIERMFDGYTVSAADAGSQFKGLDVSVPSQGIQVPGLTVLLDKSKTGVDMPKAFSDLQPLDPDTMKQEEDNVNKAFSEAADAYSEQRFGATDTGDPATERRNVALLDTVELNRQWADFAAMIGDSTGAADHQKAADDAQSQIDPTFSLASGIVPPQTASTAAPSSATP